MVEVVGEADARGQGTGSVEGGKEEGLGCHAEGESEHSLRLIKLLILD